MSRISSLRSLTGRSKTRSRWRACSGLSSRSVTTKLAPTLRASRAASRNLPSPHKFGPFWRLGLWRTLPRTRPPALLTNPCSSAVRRSDSWPPSPRLRMKTLSRAPSSRVSRLPTRSSGSWSGATACGSRPQRLARSSSRRQDQALAPSEAGTLRLAGQRPPAPGLGPNRNQLVGFRSNPIRPSRSPGWSRGWRAVPAQVMRRWGPSRRRPDAARGSEGVGASSSPTHRKRQIPRPSTARVRGVSSLRQSAARRCRVSSSASESQGWRR